MHVGYSRRFRMWWYSRSNGITWGVAMHWRKPPSRPVVSLSGIPGHWGLTIGKYTWDRTTPPMTQSKAAERGMPVRYYPKPTPDLRK